MIWVPEPPSTAAMSDWLLEIAHLKRSLYSKRRDPKHQQHCHRFPDPREKVPFFAFKWILKEPKPPQKGNTGLLSTRTD